MTAMKRVVRRLALLVLLSVAVPGLAHDGRPISVEVRQLDAMAADTGEIRFDVEWRIPPVFEPAEVPAISLQGGCSTDDVRPPSLIGKRRYVCGDLTSLAVGLTFPGGNPSLSSVVRLVVVEGDVEADVEGEARFIHTGPEFSRIPLDFQMQQQSLLARYISVGFDHILSGYDHLLFLVCVIWLAFSWRRIVLAVTGFTIAHSITLGLAALEVISPRVAPTEVLIALSIVFVAAELVRKDRQTLSWRYPVLVSSLFGLLHGLGFASALRDIGLPSNDSLLALFAFNVGVELGQLLFVLVVLAAALLVDRISAGRFRPRIPELQALSGYSVGLLAAFWFVQRLVPLI